MPEPRPILKNLEPDRVARFWIRVERGGEDDCWLWTGGISSDGYGQHWIRDLFRPSAHRIAWALHHGQEPGLGHVCHRCDQPLCCNPAHLFLGDARINAQDKVAKRRARGRFSAKPPHAHRTVTGTSVRPLPAGGGEE